MKKLWFFDLDGTLADTDRDIREAWKATLADLGLEFPGFDAGFVAGPPIEDMAKTLFPEIYTDALGAAIRKGFGEHYDNDGFPNTVEYPGIIDRVRELKAAGATVVVATNKRCRCAADCGEVWLGTYLRRHLRGRHVQGRSRNRQDDEVGASCVSHAEIRCSAR